MKNVLIFLAMVVLISCGGGGSGGGSSNSDDSSTNTPDPAEIVSVTYFEWWNYFSSSNPTPLTSFNEGDLVVWEVCAHVSIDELSHLEFSLFFPSPFVGQPTYFFDYGPFKHSDDFMCFTNFDRSKGPLEAAWIVETPRGDWLLSWRVIDSLDQESFPFDEIYRIR